MALTLGNEEKIQIFPRHPPQTANEFDRSEIRRIYITYSWCVCCDCSLIYIYIYRHTTWRQIPTTTIRAATGIPITAPLVEVTVVVVGIEIVGVALIIVILRIDRMPRCPIIRKSGWIAYTRLRGCAYKITTQRWKITMPH